MAKLSSKKTSNKKAFAKGASVRKGYTPGQKDLNPFSIGTHNRITKRKRPISKGKK